MVFGGLCGAVGGADNSSKSIRRILLPLTYSGYMYQQTENIMSFLLMFFSLAFSMGYGIPDETDKGSVLGRFWYKITNKNHSLSDIFTRGTIGITEIIILTTIPLLYKNWIPYIVSSAIILLANICVSWRNLGCVTMFNRKLLWSEIMLYGFISLAISITIVTVNINLWRI
jgi:hypothetical protein